MQAHNGYIDIVNETGIVGLTLLVVALVTHTMNISKVIRSGDASTGIFHAAILISALFINYAESSLLRTTHLWWILICCSIFEVHARALPLAIAASKTQARPQSRNPA